MHPRMYVRSIPPPPPPQACKTDAQTNVCYAVHFVQFICCVLHHQSGVRSSRVLAFSPFPFFSCGCRSRSLCPLRLASASSLGLRLPHHHQVTDFSSARASGTFLGAKQHASMCYGASNCREKQNASCRRGGGPQGKQRGSDNMGKGEGKNRKKMGRKKEKDATIGLCWRRSDVWPFSVFCFGLVHQLCGSFCVMFVFFFLFCFSFV
ncbi:hypothetical protein TRSC58_07316 [Trypanosoma rangeli SC58]|uniref:Uncharacterized protein n=1 Tax=Trypanosoma rangeli SC58 TaxID=429131 RepID=A0A061IS43_TRYRA|nr:hypothetical protein TRSC58_07316 [Trypanosoma rangeli SC58]